MSTTGKRQPTMEQLLKAARAKFGARARVSHYPNAPDAAKRAEWHELNSQANERIKAIEAQLGTLPADLDEQLRLAAQFVCDVSGDHPSIHRMAGVLTSVNLRKELRDERKDLKDERATRSEHHRRYSVSVDQLHGLWSVQQFDADTAAELMDKIKGNAK